MTAWPEVALGETCSLITDGKHGDCQNEEYSGYYFISCKDVKGGRINYEAARQITHSDYLATHRRTNLQPGDVVVTNSGTIGRLAIAREDEKTERTTFQKSVAVLKPVRERLTSEFLYYSLVAERERLINSAGGAAQKNLLLGELRRFAIRVPPMPEQKAITGILANYDDLIENNRRKMALLEEAARQLYFEWFVRLRFPGHEHTRITDGVPEGWMRTAFGDLCDAVRDAVKPNMLEPETPYIGLEHIPRRSIALSEWGAAEQVTSSKLRFTAGDVIFGKIRPYFHKVGIAFVDGVASSDAIVIRARNTGHRGFVLMTASSDPFVADTAQSMREGAKMPRADWKQMQAYPIPLPPAGLLGSFEATIETIVGQLKLLTIANQRLRAARDILLPRLMSGEIAV